MLDLNYIRKFQTGGSVIDTQALEKDLKNDPRFFRNGHYTNSGRRRLASIREISDNQDKGYTYDINQDNKTFRILDEEGGERKLGDGYGHGLQTSETRIALTRDKRNRKEVSKTLDMVLGKQNDYLVSKNGVNAKNNDANINDNSGSLNNNDKLLPKNPVVTSDGGATGSNDQLKSTGITDDTKPKDPALDLTAQSTLSEEEKASIYRSFTSNFGTEKADELIKRDDILRMFKDYDPTLSQHKNHDDIIYAINTGGFGDDPTKVNMTTRDEILDNKLPKPWQYIHSRLEPIAIPDVINEREDNIVSYEIPGTPFTSEKEAIDLLNNPDFPREHSELKTGQEYYVKNSAGQLIKNKKEEFYGPEKGTLLYDKNGTIIGRSTGVSGKNPKTGKLDFQRHRVEGITPTESTIGYKVEDPRMLTQNSVDRINPTELNKIKSGNFTEVLDTRLAPKTTTVKPISKEIEVDQVTPKFGDLDKVTQVKKPLYNHDSTTQFVNNLDKQFKQSTIKETDPQALKVIGDLWRKISGYENSDRVYKKEFVQSTPWSAVTTSGIVMSSLGAESADEAKDMGFRPAENHSAFIYDAFQTNKNPQYIYNMFTAKDISEANSLSKGDIIFKGREYAKDWDFSKFEKTPEGFYPSHSAVVVDIGYDGGKGAFIVIAHGNESQTFKKDKIYLNDIPTSDWKGILKRKSDKTASLKKGGLVLKFQGGSSGGGFYAPGATGDNVLDFLNQNPPITTPVGPSGPPTQDFIPGSNFPSIMGTENDPGYFSTQNPSRLRVGLQPKIDSIPPELLTLREEIKRTAPDQLEQLDMEIEMKNYDAAVKHAEVILKDKKGFNWPRQVGADGTKTGFGQITDGLGRLATTVQANDIAQYMLARQAYNRKPVYESSALKRFVPMGGRNVLAASDFKPELLNKAYNDINQIRTPKTSDPLLNQVAALMAGSAKNNARLDLSVKRAENASAEKNRVANEMEQRRQQLSQDNVRAEDVRFGNAQSQVEDARIRQSLEDQRVSEWKQNLGSMAASLQGRWNARMNNEREMRYKSALNANQNDYDNAANAYQTANNSYYANLPGSVSSQEKLDAIKKEFDDYKALEGTDDFDPVKLASLQNRYNIGQQSFNNINSLGEARDAAKLDWKSYSDKLTNTHQSNFRFGRPTLYPRY